MWTKLAIIGIISTTLGSPAVLMAADPSASAAHAIRSAFDQYESFFKSIDIDSSGFISKDELNTAAQTRHQRIDRDGDSYIDIDEIMQFERKLTRSSAHQRIASLDTNGDRRISLHEATRASENTMRHDTNRDGRLTFSEFVTTAHPAIQRYYDQVFYRSGKTTGH